MPLQKTQALVIRKVDFSETSQVIRFYTKDCGKITALAKGSKRNKNTFSGVFDHFILYEIVYIDKQPNRLDIVTQAEIIEDYRGLCKDFSTNAMASYIIEFTDELTADGQHIPNFFDLVIQSIKKLLDDADLPTAEQAGKNKALFCFEAKALKLLGYFPKTENCCICERSIIDSASVFFTAKRGGAICNYCSRGEAIKVLTTYDVLKYLKKFSDGEITSNFIDSKIYSELRKVLNIYVQYLMEKEPNSLKFIHL